MKRLYGDCEACLWILYSSSVYRGSGANRVCFTLKWMWRLSNDLKTNTSSCLAESKQRLHFHWPLPLGRVRGRVRGRDISVWPQTSCSSVEASCWFTGGHFGQRARSMTNSNITLLCFRGLRATNRNNLPIFLQLSTIKVHSKQFILLIKWK